MFSRDSLITIFKVQRSRKVMSVIEWKSFHLSDSCGVICDRFCGFNIITMVKQIYYVNKVILIKEKFHDVGN